MQGIVSFFQTEHFVLDKQRNMNSICQQGKRMWLFPLSGYATESSAS